MMPATSAEPANKWAVVAALFVVAVAAWGLALYGLGFYLRELHQLRGWSVTTLSLITFCFHLVTVGASFWVSRGIATKGPRTVFAIGAIFITLGVGAVANASTLWQLVGAYILLSFGWSSINSNPISATVLSTFGERSGAALTVALTGASLGGILVVPLLTASTTRWGFRTAVSGIGLGAGLMVLALALLVLPSAPTSAGDRAGSKDSKQGTAWHLTRTGKFWVVALGLALAISVQVGFLVHQLNFLADTVSDSTGAAIVALTTASAMVGRLGFLALADRVPAAASGGCYVLIQAPALLMFGITSYGGVGLAILSAVMGFSVGVLITIPALVTREAFPDEPFTSSFPVVNAVYLVGVAVGPPLTGVARDVLDGYRPAMVGLGVTQFVAAGLLLATLRLSPSRPAG